MSEVVDLGAKLAAFSDRWHPRIVAELNGQHVKLVKVEGTFVWHSHAEADELFLVLEGRLRMDFRDRSEWVETGQMIVVPRGVEHRPHADAECAILLVEPAGTVNTGDAGGERTVDAPEWI